MRIAVVGFGPLPFEQGDRHDAAGIRSWQFANALATAGHETALLSLRSPESKRRTAGSPAVGRLDTLVQHELSSEDVQDPRSLRRRIEELGAHALVGATAYGSFLAARAVPDLPLWVDLFGDPIAEAQAAVASGGDRGLLEDAHWLMDWCLRRGDRFSVVSDRQRLALFGQLGLGGRSLTFSPDELVHVIPEAAELLEEARNVPDDAPFRVLASGSFNFWIDGSTLISAIALALPADHSIEFVVTGGGIPGYLEGPWRLFRSQLEELKLDYADRIAVKGWVSASELAEIESLTACGVVPERPLIERELGGQNRSLRWMSRGIPVITTALSSTGQAIGERRLGLLYEPSNPRSLAEAITTLARNRGLRGQLGRNARNWVATERSIAATTSPLCAWAENPTPAPDRVSGDAIRFAERQAERLRDQLLLERNSRSQPF